MYKTIINRGYKNLACSLQSYCKSASPINEIFFLGKDPHKFTKENSLENT
jgi:hypothetical protein